MHTIEGWPTAIVDRINVYRILLDMWNNKEIVLKHRLPPAKEPKIYQDFRLRSPGNASAECRIDCYIRPGASCFSVVVRSESPLYSLSIVKLELNPNSRRTSISDQFITSDHNMKRGGPGVCCWLLIAMEASDRVSYHFRSEQSRTQIGSNKITV